MTTGKKKCLTRFWMVLSGLTTWLQAKKKVPLDFEWVLKPWLHDYRQKKNVSLNFELGECFRNGWLRDYRQNRNLHLEFETWSQVLTTWLQAEKKCLTRFWMVLFGLTTRLQAKKKCSSRFWAGAEALTTWLQAEKKCVTRFWTWWMLLLGLTTWLQAK